MSRYHGSPMSAEDLVIKLNEGGWMVYGGRLTRDRGFGRKPSLPVLLAQSSEDELEITTAHVTFQVTSTDIIQVHPWEIVIHETFAVIQNRKLNQGGGWHEVPAVRSALRMWNPRLGEIARNAWATTIQHQEQEQKRREEEALETARQRVAADFTADYVDRRIVCIVVECNVFYIQFDDNSELDIRLDGGANDAQIVANGTSLRSFQEATRSSE